MKFKDYILAQEEIDSDYFEEPDNEPDTWYDKENDKTYWVCDGYFFETSEEMQNNLDTP